MSLRDHGVLLTSGQPTPPGSRRKPSPWLFVLGALTALFCARPAHAHPMGNFSINHYTRLEVSGSAGAPYFTLKGIYVLDLAEIPTVGEKERLDANHDGVVSVAERASYLQAECDALNRELNLTIDGRKVPLLAHPDDLTLRPGAGGLPTLRLTLKFTAELSALPRAERHRVEYADNNFPQRTGWKEIVLTDVGHRVLDASVSATDISRELTLYPTDATIAPPQSTEAHFSVVASPAISNSEPGANLTAATHGSKTGLSTTATRLGNPPTGFSTAQSTNRNSATPQDRFTQSIAMTGLTPGLIFLALLSAFGFGALHALAPGHGKAMVAAYLVGTRGTARHAILLGLVVTLTHTLGVFALGLITLAASRRIVPEHLYPVISALSGLAVVVMGAGMLWQRLRAWKAERAADAAEGENHPKQPEFAGAGSDEFLYARRNGMEAPSLRTLIGLGITGGALPCPSALIVMLSAIALHRILFGLVLIVAFSAGLAVVLTVLGLLLMRARHVLERFAPPGRLMTGLSVCSAAFVTAVGLVLLARALTGSY